LSGLLKHNTVYGVPPPPDKKAKRTVDHFSVVLTLTPDRAQLQLCGELDMAATDELTARLDEACAAGLPLLLIDIAQLSYCDSSGIHVFLRAAARCASTNTEMQIVGTRSNVRRIFELTDTVALLNLANDGHEEH
jgi:anti-anti-sigma factor